MTTRDDPLPLTIEDAYPRPWLYDESRDTVYCAHCGCDGDDRHAPGCVLDTHKTGDTR